MVGWGGSEGGGGVGTGGWVGVGGGELVSVWGGVLQTKNCMWEDMDIFWNNTIPKKQGPVWRIYRAISKK